MQTRGAENSRTGAPEKAHGTPKPRKLRQHTSGIRHDSWGMEARFSAGQDTLSFLETLSKLWSKQPTGPEQQRPFFVGVTLGNLINESDQQPTLFADSDRRGELSRTLDKLNLKYGHTNAAFCRHAARARQRTHSHRIHADSCAVRRGLHVATRPCLRSALTLLR